MAQPKIGLVTVLFNCDEVLDGFFRSLSIQTFTDWHLYLVDNSANEVTRKIIEELSAKYGINDYTHIENEGNIGVAAGNNRGIGLSRESGTSHTLLLNNDIDFHQPNLLKEIYNYAITHGEYLIIPKILYHNTSTVWMAGGYFRLLRATTVHRGENCPDGSEYNDFGYYDYAPTCFMLIDNKIFQKFGLMDEKYFVYYDDSDFIFRVNKKYRVKLLSNLIIYHKVSYSTGGDESLFSIYYGIRNRIFFIRKHYPFLLKIVALSFVLSSRAVKWLCYSQQQRAKLLKGLYDGFKIKAESSS